MNKKEVLKSMLEFKKYGHKDLEPYQYFYYDMNFNLRFVQWEDIDEGYQDYDSFNAAPFEGWHEYIEPGKEEITLTDIHKVLSEINDKMWRGEIKVKI
jgi:hypothetical protein